MIYQTYGRTGEKVSAIGFGGMRFHEPEQIGKNAELVLYAHERGINYFDTAPLYCMGRSEENFGAAFRQLPRDSFYVSTKCFESDGDKLRASLETSLEKMGLQKIDFFHIWGLKSMEEWAGRKKGGALAALLAARDEGLIGHAAVSIHMTHDEADCLFDEGVFEGVTLGYNAIQFLFREQTVNRAGSRGIGVVTMNPLAGGLIPQHAERFDFIRSPEDPDVVTAGLRFILSHPSVTCALVGLSTKEQVDQAVAATTGFRPVSSGQREAMKKRIEKQFSGLCTGCGYCLPCPQGVRIPLLMDGFNMRILQGSEDHHVVNRLKYHWGLTPDAAEACTACGACEKACTQHLPIIERLAEMAAIARRSRQGS